MATFDDNQPSRFEDSLAWQNLIRKIGHRYHDCKLSTFIQSTDPTEATRQGEIIEKLRRFGETIQEQTESGHGLFWYGPAGTGKDHLMTAMMRVAMSRGIEVGWENGVAIFEERRDAIQQGFLERDIIDRYTSPHILAISDPLPPVGALRDGQMEYLFRMIDQRYRQRKPTWLTCNVAGSEEASTRLGVQVFDRLRDGALPMFCNWSSYRKPIKV